MRRLFSDIFVFCIPASMFLYVHLVGKIFICELVFLVCLVPLFAMTRARALSERAHKTFVVLCLVWLVSQVVTDLYRGTTLHNCLRGWALISMTIVNFSFLVMLIRDDMRRIRLFFLGLICGQILMYYLHPIKLAIGTGTDEYWKFGLGFPVTFLGVFLCLHPAILKSKRRVATVFFTLGILNMLLGFRSLGGVSFASGVFILSRGGGMKLGRRSPWGRFMKLLCAGASAVLAFYSLSWVYNFSVHHALTTYNLVAKNRDESGNHGLFDLLLGGRPEIYVSLHAIMASPIIGHGSWASSEHYAEMLAAMRAYGFHVIVNHKRSLIPTHSYLFGAWVDAGIMGAVFWGWVFYMVCRCLLLLRREDHPLLPIAVLMNFAMLWNILFSPYGFSERLTVPFNMVMLFAIIRSAEVRSAVSIKSRRIVNGRTAWGVECALRPLPGRHGQRANI